MSQKDRKSLLSFLKILMLHILKWKNQPTRQSASWVNSINYSRTDIQKIQKRKPSLSDDYIKKVWEEELHDAVKDAEKEMNQEATDKKLTWDEVFKNKYTLMLIVLLAISGVLMVMY